MAVRRHQSSRSSRIDPSLPKIPLACACDVTIVAGNPVITAPEQLMYNKGLGAQDPTDALPGFSVETAGGVVKAGSVTINPGNVATIHLIGGTVGGTGSTVNLSPVMQALRSQKGGVLVIGRHTF